MTIELGEIFSTEFLIAYADKAVSVVQRRKGEITSDQQYFAFVDMLAGLSYDEMKVQTKTDVSAKTLRYLIGQMKTDADAFVNLKHIAAHQLCEVGEFSNMDLRMFVAGVLVGEYVCPTGAGAYCRKNFFRDGLIFASVVYAHVVSGLGASENAEKKSPGDKANAYAAATLLSRAHGFGVSKSVVKNICYEDHYADCRKFLEFGWPSLYERFLKSPMYKRYENEFSQG